MAKLQSDYQKDLGFAMLLMPKWKVVWGPKVWKNSPNDETSGPDNTWFVAKAILNWGETTRNTYVVSIAGTSSESAYDMAREDLEVSIPVDFKGWIESWPTGATPPQKSLDPDDASRPYISYGTSLGIYQLLTQESPGPMGQTLPRFLSTIPQSDNAVVIFTGHSLGGALAPTLGLGLLESGSLPNIASADIRTFPTAGPSPGNRKFAQLFKEKLPGQRGEKYKNWNLNLWNTLDIVPQAWSIIPAEPQNLNNIPGIYQNNPPLAKVRDVVDSMIDMVPQSRIAYAPLPGASFSGTQPPSPPATFQAFFQQAHDQHVDAYLDYFGFPLRPRQINFGLSVLGQPTVAPMLVGEQQGGGLVITLRAAQKWVESQESAENLES